MAGGSYNSRHAPLNGKGINPFPGKTLTSIEKEEEMKKILCVLGMAVLLNSGAAFAEDIAGKFGVGGNWFFYLANNSDFEGDDFENEATVVAFNLHSTYCLPQLTGPINLNLGVDWEYISREITTDEDVDPFSDNIGTLTMMPLMVNVQGRYTELGKVVPYLGVGIGISINSFTKGDLFKDLEDEDPAVLDTNININDYSFCLKIPLGVDVFITKNIAVNVEAKYFYTNPSFDIEVEDVSGTTEESDDVSQSTIAFGLGGTLYY
jgi:opacity protein-like surface antigen